MAIDSVVYKDGFRIQFRWMAGVRGTVIYSVAKGDVMPDGETLKYAAQTGGLSSYNGFSYGSGTGSVSYAPARDLQGKWVDICYLDYDNNWEIVAHERYGSYFNGMCKVDTRIERMPINENRHAIEITIQNRSKFDIEADGVGYSINGRPYGIPVRLEHGKRIVLPQFDVGAEDSVKMCQMEGTYPAEFRAIIDV